MGKSQRAVIFDLDGVVVFTEPLKAQSHVETVQYFGGTVTPDLYLEFMGLSQEVVSSAFISASGIDTNTTEYSKIFHQNYHDLLDKGIKIMPGVIQFINKLSEMGYKIGLVSSSNDYAIRKILTSINVIDLFDVIISSELAENKKPAPDPYMLALKTLEVTAKSAVVFEDSVAGMQSAESANISVIAVRHKYNLTKDFSIAAFVVDSFEPIENLIPIVEKLTSSRQNKGS